MCVHCQPLLVLLLVSHLLCPLWKPSVDVCPLLFRLGPFQLTFPFAGGGDFTCNDSQTYNVHTCACLLRDRTNTPATAGAEEFIFRAQRHPV